MCVRGVFCDEGMFSLLDIETSSFSLFLPLSVHIFVSFDK